jgi:N-acetylmuramoyl-L-alanine amidase
VAFDRPARRFALSAACAAALALALPGAAAAEPRNIGTVPEPVPGTELAGKIVFLDPGHQGGSGGNDMSREVPDGRGSTKPCQNTGATMLNGVPEHTVNWNVAQLVRGSLESLGARVVMSRPDDTGWGGCVDERAYAANASGADLAISIHADSTVFGVDEKNAGFHLITPTLPIPDAAADSAQALGGARASAAVRDAYLDAGFTPANYQGVNGINPRDDIAGLTLATVPAVFVEMGNGSNPGDAALLESTEGQLEHAIAIINGAVTYLMTPAAAPAPDPGVDLVRLQAESSATLTEFVGPMIAEAFIIVVQALQQEGVPGLENLTSSQVTSLVSDLASAVLGIIAV